MKRSTLKIVILLISFNLSAQNDSTKVLFIGNSITYFNDMPIMFKDIANNKGKKVSVEMYAPGGTGFVNHYVDPNVYSLFRNTNWDVIVLQPGSGESPGVSFPVDTTVKRGRILLDSIYHYNPCARVYLYQIPYGVPSATTYNTYFSVQTMIRDSVTKMADSLQLQMIPAGECARAYYSNYQNLLLHNSYNDIHPNANGSFLVASACYSTIFQDSITNCSFYSSVEQDTAQKFFSIVDSVVLKYFSNWRINTYNLHAGFNCNQTGNAFAFNNLSLHLTSVLWDFGDNTTSTSSNPNHWYTANGTYTVKLFAYRGNCVDSTIKFITINATRLNDINNSGYNIFPNPSNGIFEIKFEAPEKINSIMVYSSLGALVASYNINQAIDNYHINLKNLKKGLYVIEINGDGNIIRKRCMIE